MTIPFKLQRVRHSLRTISAQIPLEVNSALKVAIALAIVWWVIALLFRAGNRIPVWYDEETTFTRLPFHIADPYEVKGFVNPPWTALLLAPFSFLPLSIAPLAQFCIYFVLLTAVIFKFGGNTKT